MSTLSAKISNLSITAPELGSISAPQSDIRIHVRDGNPYALSFPNPIDIREPAVILQSRIVRQAR
jgi:hypothetical protein